MKSGYVRTKMNKHSLKVFMVTATVLLLLVSMFMFGSTAYAEGETATDNQTPLSTEENQGVTYIPVTNEPGVYEIIIPENSSEGNTETNAGTETNTGTVANAGTGTNTGTETNDNAKIVTYTTAEIITGPDAKDDPNLDQVTLEQVIEELSEETTQTNSQTKSENTLPESDVSEHIYVETQNIELKNNPASNDTNVDYAPVVSSNDTAYNGSLQQKINDAINLAISQDLDTATVEISDGETFSDKFVVITKDPEGKIQAGTNTNVGNTTNNELTTVILKKSAASTNAVTVNSEIAVTDNLTLKIIDLLFGKDCIIEADSGTTLQIGKEDSVASDNKDSLFNGTAKIVVGNPESEGDEATVEVFAKNGAKIIANVKEGSITVNNNNINTDGTVTHESVTFSGYTTVSGNTGNTTVSVNSYTDGKLTTKEDDRNYCKVVINGSDETTIKQLNAWDTNVVVSSAKVVVDKRSDGKSNSVYNLMITSTSNNKHYFDMSEAMNLPGILAALGFSSLFKVNVPVDNSMVIINGDISARKNILVYSDLKQEGFLIDSYIANIACNVKLGSASITVSNGVTLDADNDIILKASSKATAGMDEYGNLNQSVLPIAFNIFLENVSINIGNGTIIHADKNVEANALSVVNAGALCSFDYLMVGLAFNVVVNESSVVANGSTLTSDYGNVSLISKATTKAVADAKRSKGNKSADGMYFATNVVKQTSKTYVGENTLINAKYDVNINSTSDVNSTDDAIASGVISTNIPEEKTAVKTILRTVICGVIKGVPYTILTSPIVKSVIGDARGYLDSSIGKAITGKLGGFVDTAVNKILGINQILEPYTFTVEIDSAALEKGTVKAAAKEKKDGNNTYTELVVTVNSEYHVEKVLVRYLEPTTTEYKFIDIYNKSDYQYTLDMTSLKTKLTLKELRVYVFYGNGKNTAEQKSNPDDSEDDAINLEDFFNLAVQSTTEDQDADKDCAGNIYLNIGYLPANEGLGKIVTDAMVDSVTKDTKSLKSLLGVAAGKSVRLNVNPNSYGKIEKIIYTYIKTDGVSSGVIEITKNNSGHYVFTVPEDVKIEEQTIKDQNGNNQTGMFGVLTITATFKNTGGADTTDTQTPAKNQVTGSLGVGIAINTNSAVIDTGANSEKGIRAGGKVNLLAEANTNVKGVADGTAATQEQKAALKVNEQSEQKETFETVTDEKKTAKLIIYGNSEIDSSTTKNKSRLILSTTNKTYYTVELKPEGTKGYSIPDSIELVAVTEDGREHRITITDKSNDLFSVDISYVDFDNDKLQTIKQKAVNLKSISFVAHYNQATYEIAAEVHEKDNSQTKVSSNGTITINTDKVSGKGYVYGTVTPDAGYLLEYIKVIYKDAAGAEKELTEKITSSNPDYKYYLPEDSELKGMKAGSLKLVAVLRQKAETDKCAIAIKNEVDGISVSDATPYVGDTVALIGKNVLLKKDNIKVFYTKDSKEIEITLNNDLTFVVPDGANGNAIQITKRNDNYKEQLYVAVQINTSQNGTIAINNIDKRGENGTVKTGAGDILYIDVTPGTENGYSLKNGTLIATCIVGGKEIKLQAERLSSKLYQIKVTDAVGNNAATTLTLSAEFIKTERTFSAGIAIAVNVVSHKNTALINSGVIIVNDGVSVIATTNGSAQTEAYAGYSSGKTGIAGAVAVGVSNYKTYATISPSVVVAIINQVRDIAEITVKSDSVIGKFSTIADASKNSAKSGKTGVGTGIAVAVNNANSEAVLSDGVKISYKNGLHKIEVSSFSKINEDIVNAKAGANAEKIAVTPVVGLNIVTNKSYAYLGRPKNTDSVDPIDYRYDSQQVKVTSQVYGNHKMNVDASAAGNDSVMAGAFGINIIKDASKANLKSEITGINSAILVNSITESLLEAKVKSSSKGANEGKTDASGAKGSSDKKADNLIISGAAISAKTGGGLQSGISDLTTNRQQAQSTEGTVAGSAAFVLNIQNSDNEASILDGTNVVKNGNERVSSVYVLAESRTLATINADASSTTAENIGNTTAVGVAAAINIVNTKNIAFIGTGDITAKAVAVKAITSDGKNNINEFCTYSISGATKSTNAIAGSVALSVINSTTIARLQKAADDILNTSTDANGINVYAYDVRKVTTIASAKATETGIPDKNQKANTYQVLDTADAKTVGVGASIAVAYGNNKVVAEFIAPKNSTHKGDVQVYAISDHTEETTSVAGSDPYTGIFDISKYDFKAKPINVAVDATTAVNAVITTVTARIAAPANSTYTPTVNARGFRVKAIEKGHSKTESSAYAVGKDSAVGASVAVNLNKAEVTAVNECCLKASGDDGYIDDDSDYHRSVEIITISAVTEENTAYACASSTDVLRILEKYKTYLNEIAKFEQILIDVTLIANTIQNFLDGTYFKIIAKTAKEVKETFQVEVKTLLSDVKNLGFAKKDLGGYIGKIGNSYNDLFTRITMLLPGISKVSTDLMSFGTAVAFVLNIGTPSTKDMDDTTGSATKSANTAINGTSSQTGTTTNTENNAETKKEAESTQVAAAISVNISRHEVTAQSNGEIESKIGGVRIFADTNTKSAVSSTGSAESGNAGLGSIALAIAVKYEENKTTAIATKNITVGKDRALEIIANLSENIGDYINTLGVEAKAGATAGSAKVAITGALVVYISSSKTTAKIGDYVIVKGYNNDKAGIVQVYATEVSRQSMRTAAYSKSSANITLAISAGVLTSTNTLSAIVGDYAEITAKEIEVMSIKYSVSDGIQNDGIIITPETGYVNYGNTATTDTATGTTYIGVNGLNSPYSLLTINTKNASKDGKSTVEGALNEALLTELLKSALNMLSHVDYYIAIDAGSVATKPKADSPAATTKGIGGIAGSVAVIVINNTVEARIGKNAKLNSDGDVKVEAISDEQTRVIVGALSVDTSKRSASSTGAAILFITEKNVIDAEVKDGAVINCKGTFTLLAKNTGKTETYVIAASGSAKTTSNVAATIGVILSNTKVTATLGNPGTLTHVAALAEIAAENSKNLRNITVSLAVADATVQVGGAVAVVVDNSEANVVADKTKLKVKGTAQKTVNGKLVTPDSIQIRASNNHELFIIMCSASGSRGSATANVAGIISVIIDNSKSTVSACEALLTSNADDNTQDQYKCGNIVISAINNSTLLNVNVEASIGKAAVAVGASITVNILNRQSLITLYDAKKSTIKTVIKAGNGDISIIAEGNDNVIMVAAGATGNNGVGAAIQGSINVLVDGNTIAVNAAKLDAETLNIGTQITEPGNLTIASRFNGNIYGVVGGFTFTKGSAAVGATVLVLVNNNTITTAIDDAKIVSCKNALIEASATTKKLMISIGAAVAGGASVQGSIVTVVASDKIKVSLGAADIVAKELNIKAFGDASENIISGALAASKGVSVGPSILVFVKNREISILSTPGGKIGSISGCKTNISSYAKDDIFTLVLAMAASGAAAVSAGICTEVINNSVLCDIDANVNAGTEQVEIKAENNSKIRNYIFGGGFSGSVSVVPVATVIYTQGTTKTDVSGNLEGSIVTIAAYSSLDLLEVAAGVAIAGTAGVNGTVAVVVNSSTTEALFTGTHAGKGNRPELNVFAKDTYTFKSIMVALGGGLAAGVAVNAAVTVAKNTVNATVGTNTKRNSVKADTINVDAQSIRNIENIVAAGGFSGIAGVAVNIAVMVAGSKLPQDAVDMLSRTETSNKDSDVSKSGTKYSLFNPETLMKSVISSNNYVNNTGALSKVSTDIKKDLEGNGQKDSSIKDSAEKVDASGLVKDLATDKNVDYTADTTKNTVNENETLRGESDNSTVDPTSITKNNEALGSNVVYTYANAPKNAVTAYVLNVDVEADTLSIKASDTINAIVESITASFGVTCGAGAGVSVVVVHSNVIAELAANATVTCRELNIEAESKSDNIAVLGGVMGAGTVGAAVSVAVVHADSETHAKLSGTVNPINDSGAGKTYIINVVATNRYKNVSANTAAAAGGLVGVAASVAVVNFNGNISAIIAGRVNPMMSGSQVIGGFNRIYVIVQLENEVVARAASLGGGGVAVAMGVAVASETLTAEASVTGTVELNGLNRSAYPVLRIMVVGSYDNNNDTVTQGNISTKAQIASGAAGLYAAGVSVAVSNLKPTINSYISGTVKNSFANLTVIVGNSIYTKSETGLYAATAGLASFGANVLLAFNTTKAKAYVSGSVDANTLSILSLLSANAETSMKLANISGFQGGISTGIAILKAKNEAYVSDGGSIKVRTLNVSAGADSLATDQKGAEFYSYANISSAAAGFASLTVNVAIAYNEAQNIASLKTNAVIKANTINIVAYGNPTAISETKKVALQGIDAAGSAAASTLKYTQQVLIDCANLSGYTAGKYTDINAGSYMYSGAANNSQGDTVDKNSKQSSASVDVFQIQLLGINGNVAISKNIAKSEVIAVFGKAIGNVKLFNNPSANSRAQIVEAGGSALSIGANVALSYVQATFTTTLTTNGVNGTVSVITNYVSDSDVLVKAANKSLIGLNANVLVAKSSTNATTIYDGSSSSTKTTSVDVETIGESVVEAYEKKPGVSVSLASAANNIIEAILATTQSATIRNVLFEGTPDVKVVSALNYIDRNKDYDAHAKYEGTADCSLSAFDGITNVIIARNKAENKAYAQNISSKSKIRSFEVSAKSHANVFADGGNEADSTGISSSISSVGTIIAFASNNSTNEAVVDLYTAPTSSLTASADMNEASAKSVGGVSSNGVKLAKMSIGINVSTAINNAKNNAVIKNCFDGTSAKALLVDNVKANVNADNVFASAYIGTSKVVLAQANITTNESVATNNYKGNAEIKDSNMTGTKLAVESYENYKFYDPATKYITKATVGSGGTSDNSISVNLVGGTINSATAENVSEVFALISTTVLNGYKVSVIADGRSDVIADIAGGSSVGLLNVSVINTKAIANGEVKAQYNPVSNAESTIDSLKINAVGCATSESIVGVAGALVTGVNASGNIAKATTELKVKAILAEGILNVTKVADISSVGAAAVNAYAQKPKFVLSLLNFSFNDVKATSSITVETDVLPGTYHFGNLKASAKIPDENEVKCTPAGFNAVVFGKTTTDALVLPSATATKTIQLIGGQNHKATALSNHKVYTLIGAVLDKDDPTKITSTKGTITAGEATITAKGTGFTSAISDNGGTVVGGLSIGGSIVNAQENDVAEVIIGVEKLTVKDYLGVSAENKSTPDKDKVATVIANAVTPGGFSLIDLAVAESSASINMIARIILLNKCIIEDTDDEIYFSVINMASADSRLVGSKDGSAVAKINSSKVPVTATFTTEIILQENSSVTANKKVGLSTMTTGGAISIVSQSTAGAGLDVTRMQGNATVNSNNKIAVLKNAVIKSKTDDINVEMINACNMTAKSDYSTGFELIGSNKVKATNTFNASNSFEMAEGSAIESETGYVEILQNNSNAEMYSYASSQGRKYGLHRDADATALNIINSNNNVVYNLIKAPKEVALLQYGGGRKVKAESSGYINAMGVTIIGNATNKATINNTVTALSSGDLVSSQRALIGQGSDNLGFQTFCNPYGKGTFRAKVNGYSINDITITNLANGGSSSKNISDGSTQHVFVSDIDAAGSMIIELKKGEGGLFTYGATELKNNLTVKSTLESPYVLFTFYQNKYNQSLMVGGKASPVYNPDISRPFGIRNRFKQNHNGTRQLSNNVFVESFKNSVILRLNGSLTDIDYYFDDEGYFVLVNAPFFAANIEDIDTKWLQNFLTTKNVSIYANIYDAAFLLISHDEFVNGAIVPDSVVIDGNTIRVTVVVDGKTYVLIIKFNFDNNTCEVYRLSDGRRTNMSLVVVEEDNELKVIICEESYNTKSAFVFFPIIPDDDDLIIRVKLKNDTISGVKLREEIAA